MMSTRAAFSAALFFMKKAYAREKQRMREPYLFRARKTVFSICCVK